MTAPATVDRLETAFTVFRDRLQDFLDRLLGWTRAPDEAPRSATVHAQVQLELQALHIAFAQLEKALAAVRPGDLEADIAQHEARHMFRDVAVLYSTLALRCPDCNGLATTPCPCRLRPPRRGGEPPTRLDHAPAFIDEPDRDLQRAVD